MLINVFDGFADLPTSIMMFTVYSISINSSAIKNLRATIDDRVKSCNVTYGCAYISCHVIINMDYKLLFACKFRVCRFWFC